jgi:hypothetical protein
MITSPKAAAVELLRRRKESIKNKSFELSTYLFPAQLDFVNDPAPNKLAVCSRRSGKTIACAADLVNTAINNEGVVCLYITLSRNNAKKIIWREIKKINRDYDLKGEENLSELSVTFPNGSIIYLSGAKDTNEIEKFRGLALKLVYIDEAQSFREYIRLLIDDVLAPALMDYSGTLVLIGTPGPVPNGYFAECAGVAPERAAKSNTWSKHHWTFWDNPFIIKKSKRTHQQMLDRELERRGVKSTDPSIQREWFGKWVLDVDSLLLHYNQKLNHYEELPKLPYAAKWNYIMGVDLGFNDADAIAILAWSEHCPETYLVDEAVTAKQGITELTEQIQTLSKKYDISKIVMDEGGLGKKIAEEMRRQKGIPIHGADKKLKMQNVAFLNDALRRGHMKAKGASRFAQDCFLVEIDRDKTTPDRIVVKSGYHSDIIDAVLYSFKESPSFSYEPPKRGPRVGSKEWADQQQSQMFDAAQEHFAQQAELERYLSGNHED